MKLIVRFITTCLLICSALAACNPSGQSAQSTSTHAAENAMLSQTAQALTRSATSIPSVTLSLTPTPIPSATSTTTPTSSPTITPTPGPVVISAENAVQLSQLDMLAEFGEVAGIVFSPQGIAALRVSKDNTLQKTLVQQHIPLSYLGESTWMFAGPGFSADGKMYLSQIKDNNGYDQAVWGVQDDLALKLIANHFSGYTMSGSYSIFSGDGKYVAVVSIPQMIITMPPNWRQCAPNCKVSVTYKLARSGIYQLPSGNRVAELGISSVNAYDYKLDFSSDNQYLATISRRSDSGNVWWDYVQVWRVSNGNLFSKLDAVQARITEGENANLAFSPDGHYLAFIAGGKLQAWQWEQNKIGWTAHGLFTTLSFSPDGSLIVTGAPDGSV